jgi:hypothetical protein
MTLNLNSHYARSPDAPAPGSAPPKTAAKKRGKTLAKSKPVRASAAAAAKRPGKRKAAPAKKK